MAEYGVSPWFIISFSSRKCRLCSSHPIFVEHIDLQILQKLSLFLFCICIINLIFFLFFGCIRIHPLQELTCLVFGYLFSKKRKDRTAQAQDQPSSAFPGVLAPFWQLHSEDLFCKMNKH